MARPKGSKNKPKSRTELLRKQALADLKKGQDLAKLVDRQDQAIAQATDQIADLQGQVEFYRKQVNHFLALLNILAKGA